MITAVGSRDQWEWVFFPKGSDRPQRGVVAGAPDNADAACKIAIDAWCGGKASAE